MPWDCIVLGITAAIVICLLSNKCSASDVFHFVQSVRFFSYYICEGVVHKAGKVLVIVKQGLKKGVSFNSSAFSLPTFRPFISYLVYFTNYQ